jgi:hypothetical protein
MKHRIDFLLKPELKYQMICYRVLDSCSLSHFPYCVSHLAYLKNALLLTILFSGRIVPNSFTKSRILQKPRGMYGQSRSPSFFIEQM